MSTITIARSCSRAGAATSAVLAALPSGAKASLRLSCRAGREAVDAHARRLEVERGHALLSATAAARMPLLQALESPAGSSTETLALAAALRALAQGPAQLRRATVRAEGGGSALGGLVSALAGLAALTRLELDVDLEEHARGGWSAPPLMLPWAHIEVGVAAARLGGPGTSCVGCVARASRRSGMVPCALDALRCALGRADHQRAGACVLAPTRSTLPARPCHQPPLKVAPPPFSYKTPSPRAPQELELTESGCAALIPQALAQPSMPRLRSLKLVSRRCRGSNAEALTPLWAAPWFSQLRELTLTTDQGFGSRGLAPLRAAPRLRKLAVEIETLSGEPAFNAAEGRALAAAALPELRELQLYNVGPGLVAALAAAPWLSQLERLELSGGGEGLATAAGRALAAAPLPSLKRLGLRFVEPGFMAACATAAAWLTRLEHLDVLGWGGGGGGGLPEGSLAWAAAPFTALTSLTLKYDATAPPSEASLLAAHVAAPGFGHLQELRLEYYPLGSIAVPSVPCTHGAGLRALAAAPLPSLTSLSLICAGLTAADVSGVLSRAPWLATLTSLELPYNHLGAPGHRALSRLRLPRLRVLYLERNGLDWAGLTALASAPWLMQLAKLHIGEDIWPSVRSYEKVSAAVEDDASVFGCLRRRGCALKAQLVLDEVMGRGDDDGAAEGWSDPGSDAGGAG
jgi:hypothetical protein